MEMITTPLSLFMVGIIKLKIKIRVLDLNLPCIYVS